MFQGRSDGATNSANLRLAKGSNSPGSTDSLGILTFSDSGSQAAGQIQVSRDSGTWTSGSRTPGAMLFFTAPDSVSGPTERMRISSASESELTIYAGATDENYALIRGKYGTANEYNRSEVRFGVENNSSGLGFLAFATGNNSATEAMRIDSSGRVGIGTTSMGSLYAGGDDLVVGDGGASNQGMTIYTGTSQEGILAFADGTSGAAQQYAGYLLYDHSTDSFKAATSGQECLCIDSSGRLLLGTSSSTDVWGYGQGSLQLMGDYQVASASLINNENNTNSHALTLAKTRNGSILQNGDTFGSLVFSGDDGNGYSAGARIMGNVDGTPGDGDMPGRLCFHTTADGASGPTERMRIDSTGEVKITNTGSSNGSTVSQLTLYTDNSGTNDDFTQRIAFERANSAGMIYTAIDSIRTGTYNTDTVIKCNDGGTLGEKIRILSTGGITFNGDTATANALDDYEEGTFTPTLTDYNGGAVVSPTISTGNYVKIGNIVTVNYYSSSLSISNYGNSRAQIENLPFTCWNSTGHYPVAAFTHTTCFSTSAGSAATNIQNGFMGTNTTFLLPTNETATSNAMWSTGGYLMFSITYRTA
jgi:hypothetical protein